MTCSHTFRRKYIASLGLIAGCLLMPAAISAQSTLQNTNNSLQPQTAQTQDSTTTLNQTGALQQNNSQSVLSQNGSVPLGVVSDPKQSAPSNVVQPNGDLRAIVQKRGSSHTRIYVAVAIITIVALVSLAIRITARPGDMKSPVPNEAKSMKSVKKAVEPKSVAPIQAASVAQTPKKKKQTRRQRKQPAKR